MEEGARVGKNSSSVRKKGWLVGAPDWHDNSPCEMMRGFEQTCGRKQALTCTLLMGSPPTGLAKPTPSLFENGAHGDFRHGGP